ncbi:helix-turn-helix domain-containing protein [Rhodobacteraceae bacterium CY05]|uniref:Helix-turn-helix domain-containing protein n=2 Tax=Parasedimentitalea huanghaiensis TaxID=2682100 RepID=A0A6L6WKT3_9RHOB|nr:helix-turn-helix domain-containing protein [Zongyanglinia huanghaiensis]
MVSVWDTQLGILSMPTSQEGFIRLILVKPFLDYLEEKRVNPLPAIQALGINPAHIDGPQMSVHGEIIYGLLNTMAELSKDPYLGCHAGERMQFADWPPYRTAAQKSGTLGEFLTRFILEVPQQSSSVSHTLQVTNSEASYKIKRFFEPNNSPGQAEGFAASHYIRLFQLVTGDLWVSEQVRIETRFPECLPPAYSGVRVVPQSNDGLVVRFPAEWLVSKLNLRSFENSSPTAQPEASTISVIAALRSVARSLMASSDLDTDTLAQALGLDSGRLTNVLRTRKTTVASEIRKLRVDMAIEALEDSTQTIGDIGVSLGYPNQSHFTRFFRSQTGQTPSEYRNAYRKSGSQTAPET